MATKKDRKVMRREGGGPVGVEVHKMAELEACQRLLEMGAIGARTYKGPVVIGTHGSKHERLLAEVRWMAVDMFEQRKLAVAQCSLVAGMVRRYWAERSRGSLSEAASMIQTYWLSVAKEIRAPVHGNYQSNVLFKLNTLQNIRPTGSPRVSLSGPTSLLPTPTAAVINGLVAPQTPEDLHSVVPDKRALAHGLVHDWLAEREAENPPLADATTGLADFCVQIVKHRLREDHNLRSTSSSHPTAHEAPTDDVPEEPFYDDFLVPVDPFVAPGTSHARARKLAIEWAVQHNMSKRGVDGVRCQEGLMDFKSPEIYSHILVSPESIEAQKTLLTELVATNVMSKAPQLFAFAATVPAEQAVGARKPGVQDRRSKEPETALAAPRHYFLSVIFSTFSPLPWEPVEDAFLREATRDAQGLVDWDLVATSVNWRMKVWTGKDPLRSASQCQERFKELAPVESVPVDASRRKKLASSGHGTTFTPVLLKAAPKGWAVASRNQSVPENTTEEIQVDNPFNLSQMPPPGANAFERRGLFAVSKPPTNYFAKAFFHQSVLFKSVIVARGATCSERTVMNYSVQAVLRDIEPLSVSEVSVQAPPKLAEDAWEECMGTWRDTIMKIASERAQAEPPKRAFSLEDMVKKNTSAVPANVPQYISGQMVCPPHPSFASMNRIAEMTIGRLISSVSENGASNQPPPQVPVPVETLFNYCAMFRKKYPAVFTSQHKINKPSMPVPRANNQAAGAKPAPRPQVPVTRQIQAPQAIPPVVTTSQSTPAAVATPIPEPTSVPASVGQSGSASWLRTSQRQKRGSGANSRAPPSPGGDMPSTPSQQPESAYMVAGGPSLYGQFNHRSKQGR
jgi:hypothetical protein